MRALRGRFARVNWRKATTTMLVLIVVVAGAAAGEDRDATAGTEPDGVFPTDADRAVALGYLIDAPRSAEVADRALIVGEKLRRKYDIDTGRPEVDRENAARRAWAEFVERLSFTEDEIRVSAESMGYSLDPARCSNYCSNVRELATIELRRIALERFADGEPWPGTLTTVTEPGTEQQDDSPGPDSTETNPED